MGKKSVLSKFYSEYSLICSLFIRKASLQLTFTKYLTLFNKIWIKIGFAKLVT